MSQSSRLEASIWISGARVIKIRAEEGSNVREDAMAEQIRLSLVLSASFHFIIEHHMMGKQRQTLTDHALYFCTMRLLLVLVTLLKSAGDKAM